MKTQKASDSFVWAGFIASWFVTSPALTSQLHLGLISHLLQDLSRKAFPIAFLMQQSSPIMRTEKTEVRFSEVDLKLVRLTCLSSFFFFFLKDILRFD